MANKKKHLSDEERFCVEKMLKAGEFFTEIARVLGRGLSTISEEVNDNGGREKYSAEKAKHRAYLKQYRKKRRCNKVAMDSHLSRFVERKLEMGWSPGAISSRLETQSGLKYASEKSIRKYVGQRHGLERFLFWNRNNMKSGRKRGSDTFLTDPDRKFLEMRPIDALFEYGHWEADFIVSKSNSWVLLVCAEKKSKLVRMALLPNRENICVNSAIVELIGGYNPKSLTLDNDIGFGKWKELELALAAPVYFCHPYHSWEKGLVENTNRWIREFIPKKTDLKSISPLAVSEIENYLNHKARECLGGYAAYEMMTKEEYGILMESLEVNLPKLRIWG